MSIQLLVKSSINRLLKSFNLKVYSTKAFGRELALDMRNINARPKVMLDVGANVGQTVENWLREFPDADIHSFEPVSRLFNELNSRFGKQARCNQLGVGDKNEEITIHYGKHDVSHSFFHDDVGKGGEVAKVVRLDDYCLQHNIEHVDVLKIDVEGFEHNVIQGAASMLTQHKVDLLVVELGFDPKGYYTYYSDFADAMAKLGYQVLGFYDQTTQWDGRAELLFCNVLFARNGLHFAS